MEQDRVERQVEHGGREVVIDRVALQALLQVDPLEGRRVVPALARGVLPRRGCNS